MEKGRTIEGGNNKRDRDNKVTEKKKEPIVSSEYKRVPLYSISQEEWVRDG